MSLKSIINSKDKFADNLLSKFDKIWQGLTPQLQKSLISTFKAGEYTKDAITAIFAENGFDDLTGEITRQFSKVLRFSKDISEELGYNFVLTKENISLFDQMNSLNVERLYNVRDSIALDMRRFAIESKIEGRSVAQIRTGLDGLFQKMGRNLNAEIFTGLSTFESGIDLTTMLNGGITRFVYVGPQDGKTRDRCVSTLSDPRQETGWTLSDIESSETPFLERGGFNCRHRWLAFTEEVI